MLLLHFFLPVPTLPVVIRALSCFCPVFSCPLPLLSLGTSRLNYNVGKGKGYGHFPHT